MTGIAKIVGIHRLVLVPVAVTLLLAGCKTTEKVEDSLSNVFVSEGRSSTILDSRLKHLKELSEQYPRRADLHYKVAAIEFQKEDFRGSARALKEAIYLDPNRTRYHYDLGRVHLQMGELKEARDAFRKAVNVAPGDNRWSGLHSALGYTHCRLREWSEAREQFLVCIEIDERDPTPYYFLGSIADIKSDREQCIKYMREYIERGGRKFRRRATEVLALYGVKVEEVADLFGESRALIDEGSEAGTITADPDLDVFRKPLTPGE